ncbi:MAG: FkbM family methyltransferase [Rhizobiaceae bacterium]|nr:FkbM family methyltransferase [Rhizobiaceae bacterium]
MTQFRSQENKPDFVVYTCLFGYSEAFADIAYRDRNVDYVCFTDDPELKSETWKIKYIPKTTVDSHRISKRIKALPSVFLSEYKKSLYIDNTVVLKTDASNIFQRFAHDRWVMLRHPWRDCAYDEAKAVIELGYDDPNVIKAQMEAYRLAGFPAHSGLNAGTFILREHQNEVVTQMGFEWLAQVTKYSKRDQLSWNFCAWHQGFDFTSAEDNLQNNALFAWPYFKGARLPRDFDDANYLKLNPDVAQSGVNPRRHYLKVGMAEGRPYKLSASQTDVTQTIQQPSGRKIYIDLGSNHGVTIDNFLRQNPDFTVYGFEPARQLADELRRKFAGNKNVHILECAAWIENGTTTFYPGGPSDESSTLIIGKSLRSPWTIDYHKGYPVPSVDLAKWLEENTSENDLVVMKMDVEGAEYRILSRMIQTGAVSRLKEIRVGWHWDRYPNEITQDGHHMIRNKLQTLVPVVDWH